MIREFNGKRPDVRKAAFIAETAVIIGDVILGEGVTVWYGAVIRGDTGPIRIGDNSNIQDNCVLHCDEGGGIEIGKDVLIGHSSIIHGCAIKDGSMIGMGSIIMNNAQIGECTLVGAGSLITERKTIPAGMMVLGRPAQIVRALTDEEKEQIKTGSGLYVELGKLYS